MQRCLDEMEIAQMADFLLDQCDPPEAEVFLHTFNCRKCRLEVVELKNMLSDYGDYQEPAQTHPWYKELVLKPRQNLPETSTLADESAMNTDDNILSPS
jgi:hypothetical protein